MVASEAYQGGGGPSGRVVVADREAGGMVEGGGIWLSEVYIGGRRVRV